MSAIEQLYMEVQMMEEMATNLATSIQRATAAAGEAAAAVTAVKSIKDGQDSEILLQLGMGAMLRVGMQSVGSIPVDVGAGVVIEKSPGDAINYLESRIKELNVSLEQMAAQREQVVAGLEQKRRRLEEMAGSAQSAPNN